MAAPYTRRFPGGFLDKPAQTTPIEAAFLNAVEDTLIALLGDAPAADEVGVWVGGAGGGLVYQKITNAQIAAGAAIDKSKLAALNITDADIAAAAGIAKSKLGALNIANADVVAGAAIDPAKLSNPADADQVLRGNATWGRKIYRKVTAKQVVNTVAETDLLNGEITVGAGLLGTNGSLRITAHGDMLNNTAVNQALPRFKLKLGATTLLDTGALANWNTNGARQSWILQATITNLGAANSQWATIVFSAIAPSSGTTAVVFITGLGTGFQSAAAGGYGTFDYRGGGSGAVDTSVAQALALSVINGVASASYDTTLRHALVEVL